MNSNTNTLSNNSTTTSGTGSGIGNRFRGAAEVVHGAGEGLRGTFLGAVDTVVKNGATHNDEIARQGRLEVKRGIENMKGQTGANTSAYRNAASNNTAYSGAPYAASGATHAPGIGAGTTGGGALHPNHYREDAVAGIPQDELRDVQSHAAQSYSQSQEPQADGVNPVAATHGVGFANDNADAGYGAGTSMGGTYGPARVANQNMSDYPAQGTGPVTKNKQFDTANNGFALDQGSEGRGMGTRELDGRSGLN